MKVISRDEIRLDAKRVQIIYTCIDEWKRRIINSVILHRPIKQQKHKAVAE
jgi:hypothetical protein